MVQVWLDSQGFMDVGQRQMTAQHQSTWSIFWFIPRPQSDPTWSGLGLGVKGRPDPDWSLADLTQLRREGVGNPSQLPNWGRVGEGVPPHPELPTLSRIGSSTSLPTVGLRRVPTSRLGGRVKWGWAQSGCSVSKWQPILAEVMVKVKPGQSSSIVFGRMWCV